MKLLNHRHFDNGVSNRRDERDLNTLNGKVLAPRRSKSVRDAHELKINPNWPKAHLYGIRWHGTQFNMLPRGFVQTRGVIVANLGAGMVSVYRGNNGWIDMNLADFKMAFVNDDPTVYCRAIGWCIMPALTSRGPVGVLVCDINRRFLADALYEFEEGSHAMALARLDAELTRIANLADELDADIEAAISGGSGGGGGGKTLDHYRREFTIAELARQNEQVRRRLVPYLAA